MTTNLDPLTLMQRLEESYLHWAQHERLFGEEFDIDESDRRLAEIIEARAERLNVFMRNYLETLPEDQRESERARLTELLQTRQLELLANSGVLDMLLEHLESKEASDE